MAEKKNLILMLYNPKEPIFTQKGDKKTVFKVPPNFLTNRYQSIGIELQNRFDVDAGEQVTINNITPPNLNNILQLKRDENFSLFFPKHNRIATELTTLFLRAKNLDEFQSLAAYTRDRVNPYLFNYCLCVAILHRKDTRDMDIPPLMETFPDKYVESQVFAKAREEVNIVPEGSRAIYDMLGACSSNRPADTAEERAKSIFAKMDENNDGQLTQEEFLKGCLQDEELSKMLAP